jgi:cyclophilin family peptidyl-prolyl cis-trans isomerase
MQNFTIFNSRAFLSAFMALLVCYLAPQTATANFILRVQTDLGSFDIELFDVIAPLTVNNFMNYVNDGDYDDTFFHRTQSDLFIQGGGFVFNGVSGSFFAGGTTSIPRDPPVANEFNLSNVRGTVAMAKNADDPDSADSEWFVNLADNSAILDVENGGSTVFARVLGNGLDVLDEIASLLRCGDFLPGFVCGGFVETPTVDPQAVFDSNDVLVNISHIGFDNDGDGAIDSLEDSAPNGGDGNNDAILDSSQVNVASFPGAAGENITVVAPSTVSLESLDVLGVTYALNSTPISECVLNGLAFKHGYAGFKVSGVAAGGSVDIDIQLPAGDTADTYFYNGPAAGSMVPQWFEFTFNQATGVGATIDGNIVSLHLVDGGRGDADQASNGIIVVAPGGPAIRTAMLDLEDNDCDGVLDTVESGAPNKGDGNLDGIQDSLQGHVASLVDIVSDTYVTVEVPSTVLLHTLFFTDGTDFLIQASQPDTLSGLNFAHGFLSFSVEDLNPGSAVKIRLFLPGNESPVKFFKYGPTPDNPEDHLYEFNYNGETGAEINGNVVTLHFIDGQRGDSDLMANGKITDPGTPASLAKNTGTDGGGSGGGCSLNRSDSHPGQAGAWWILLGMSALYAGWRRYRR